MCVCALYDGTRKISMRYAGARISHGGKEIATQRGSEITVTVTVTFVDRRNPLEDMTKSPQDEAQMNDIRERAEGYTCLGVAGDAPYPEKYHADHESITQISGAKSKSLSRSCLYISVIVPTSRHELPYSHVPLPFGLPISPSPHCAGVLVLRPPGNIPPQEPPSAGPSPFAETGVARAGERGTYRARQRRTNASTNSGKTIGPWPPSVSSVDRRKAASLVSGAATCRPTSPASLECSAPSPFVAPPRPSSAAAGLSWWSQPCGSTTGVATPATSRLSQAEVLPAVRMTPGMMLPRDPPAFLVDAEAALDVEYPPWTIVIQRSLSRFRFESTKRDERDGVEAFF